MALRTSSDRLLAIDDLDDEALDHILTTAGVELGRRAPFVVASVFLTSSLRTRVGFAAATTRLGGTTIDVSELRWSPTMSEAESLSDTLRTVSGMVDLLVVRAPFPLADLDAEVSACPMVSAGDAFEHPTQALIDAFAMGQLAGPWSDRRIALCGDLTMRAARSLLHLLVRRPAGELVLVVPTGRDDHGVPVPEGTITCRSLDEVEGGLDVLHMIGLPPGEEAGHLDDAAREPFRLTGERLTRLQSPLVLSPMPVIDEIDASARTAPSVRFFAQNDLGVAVRAAVLDHYLG